MTAEYLESLRQQCRYSVTTLSITSGWLSRLEQFAGDRELMALRSSDLMAWRQELTWKPGPSGRLLSENTVNQAVLAVRGFYRWAVATGVLSKDPAADLKIRAVPRQRRQQLGSKDVRALLSFPDLDTPVGLRNRAVLGVLLETRISRAACSALDLAHLQLDVSALMASGRKGGVHTLSDGLLADLGRYLEEARPLLVASASLSQALFLNRKGQRLSQGSVHAITRGALAGSGLPTTLFSS